MVTSKKDIICEYAQNSLNDVVSFAKFVSYAEEFVQSNELFKMRKVKRVTSKYGSSWKLLMHLPCLNGKVPVVGKLADPLGISL